MKLNNTHFIFGLLAVSCSLLALSIFLLGAHPHIALTTDFYGVGDLLSPSVFNLVASAAYLLAALLAVASIVEARYRTLLGAWLIVISLVPLLSLFANSMWIESLGGFPAIGSGQGVIKYFALLAIGIWLLPFELPRHAQVWISILPVLLVLLWIGGMKFTLLEAKGIEPLVQSSPFMSWMYTLWDVQTTSNLIGVYDLIAVLILVLAIYQVRLLLPAIVMSGAVFVVTQTFLISWDGALSAESILSTGGHFLIKDLWYLANLVIFWQLVSERRAVLANPQ